MTDARELARGADIALNGNPGAGRYHALDNLRAVMMWLGIVFHVASLHLAWEVVRWRAPETTPLANLLAAFIHAFRMPVFFILAGYFVLLLVQRRGVKGMLTHRLMRIGLPFLIFWPPLFISIAALTTQFVGRMSDHVPPITLAPPGERFDTLHLWFLYLLIWFTLLTVPAMVCIRRMGSRRRSYVQRMFESLALMPCGACLLALPLAALGSVYESGIVTPGGSFMPPLAEWLHNGAFFIFGTLLFVGSERLLPHFERNCWRYGVQGLAFFAAAMWLGWMSGRGRIPYASTFMAMTYNCASWCLSFALIGGFRRYLFERHAWLEYVAKSSYWVYLVHMPVCLTIGLWLFDVPLPAVAKMSINVLLTTAICMATYELLVRGTMIGRLLNGPRQRHDAPRGGSEAS